MKPPAATRPAQRIDNRTLLIILSWLAAAISVGAMAMDSDFGRDVHQCWIAIQSVSRGGSPYSEGIAAMKAYHSLVTRTAGDRGPVLYIYSPMTTPVLRLLTRFPGWLLASLYGCAAAAGFLLQLRAGYEMASEQERRWLVFLLPFAAFFPGLLADITIVVGNVAYPLYGLILCAAIPGWKRNRWLWFYVAVIAASILKAPMLTLLAFPILVGRRQWVPAGIAGALGCLLFAIQPFCWPAQFQEYLLAVRLAFEWVHSFGFGPAGVLGNLLCAMNKPYSQATTIAYLVWAVALGSLLLAISHRVRSNSHLRDLWIPVAFVGTILMNPRVTFYDTAPLTVPLLLIAWRVLLLGQKLLAQWETNRNSITPHPPSALQTLRQNHPLLVPALTGVGWFATCNIVDMIWGDRLPMELTVLLLVFALGAWSLFRAADHFSQNDPLPKI